MVVVVGPTIARPGSIDILGTESFAFSHSDLITLAIAGITCAGDIALSFFVYAIPYPPPRFNSANSFEYLSLKATKTVTNLCAANSNPDTSNICEPMWQ